MNTTAQPTLTTALANLTLEAKHFRNTGKGAQFLDAAIAAADQALAAAAPSQHAISSVFGSNRATLIVQVDAKTLATKG